MAEALDLRWTVERDGVGTVDLRWPFGWSKGRNGLRSNGGFGSPNGADSKAVNGVEKETLRTELQHTRRDPGVVGHLARKKKAGKNSQKAYQSVVRHRKDAANKGHEHSSRPRSLNLAATLEALRNQIHHESGLPCSSLQRSISNGNHDQVDEISTHVLQMSAEAVVHQMFVDRKYFRKCGSSHQSRQFLDALEVLNLNSELLMKLLQDPNSLLAKRIQCLGDLQAEKEKRSPFPEVWPPECGTSYPRKFDRPIQTLDIHRQTIRKSFWRKVKYGYGCTWQGCESPQPSKRIVVLRPSLQSMQDSTDIVCRSSSLQSHHNLNKDKSSNPTSFLFRDFRRKVKHSQWRKQKEQHWISMDGSIHKLPCDCQGSDDVLTRTAKSSADAKRRSKRGKPRDVDSSTRSEVSDISGSDCRTLNLSTASCSKQRGFDIFLEAKRHLADRLKNAEKAGTLSGKQAPRTLGRILSSPEHDFLARRNAPRTLARILLSPEHDFLPTLSPRRDKGHATVSLRLQKDNKTSCPSPLRQNEYVPPYTDEGKPDGQLQIFHPNPTNLKKLHPETKANEIICSMSNDLNSNGHVVKIDDISGDVIDSEMCVEQHSLHVTNAERRANTTEDCPSKKQPLESLSDASSSNPSSIWNVEATDSTEDKEEHRSPVSILQPFFVDDISSPTSAITNPAESPLQPRHIDFEERSLTASPLYANVSSGTCMEEQKPISTYVRTVLQASRLNWEELLVKRLSSDQLLNPSLFDGVEMFHPDLLSDCIYEVLLEAYKGYFGCSPWLSTIRPEILRAPLEEKVVDEVMKEVYWYLRQPIMPRTLEHLVGNDMAKSGKWFDIRLDTEEIVIQIVEDVLQESIMETVLDTQI
ncbi:hypothetical protein RJ639_011382 [Escallonia herrerae]|uniref:DUF4378 domain-containing protein n=1 Tax=Escallonia herrerae TaxID=1293975 RepID=A0AA88VLF5_9ASTE|nr:hypothetical protein RJ639_011382 [Escallonia herrerae]